jgi:hypothetical protein
MATFYSNPRCAMKIGFFAAVLIFAAGVVLADETVNPTNQIFAARTRAEFQRAQKQFESNTNNSTNAWQFARACFDFADFATNKTERAAIARQGIAACRQLLACESNSAPGHYYLGLNFGQLARAEAPSLAAYRLVHEMEREFKMADDLDSNLDFAGPARSLGLLYRDAPGWPFSIGSRRKAQDFLEQAARLAPDYPENVLNLAESFLKWNEPAAAEKELNALGALWSKARNDFTGEKWEQSWADWTARRAAARKKLEEMSRSTKSRKEE